MWYFKHVHLCIKDTNVPKENMPLEVTCCDFVIFTTVDSAVLGAVLGTDVVVAFRAGVTCLVYLCDKANSTSPVLLHEFLNPSWFSDVRAGGLGILVSTPSPS